MPITRTIVQILISADSPECSLSDEVWWPDLHQRVTEWESKMKRDGCRPQRNQAKTGRETTALNWWENMGCLHLSVYHLAVCLRWAGFHTSSERGHLGLSTDMKIRTIVQLIGILWSYFGVQLGSADSPFYFACHSATSWHILGYHISDGRGHL